MAKPAAGRRPVLWLVGSVVVVVILVVVALISSPGTGPSTTIQTDTSTTSVTTSVATTCEGTSTSQTLSVISGRTVVGTTGEVAAGVPCADGHLGTTLTYAYGQQINIEVTVPNSLTPTGIQTLYDGNPNNSPGTPNPWNVTSTGHTYTLSYGAAGESTLTFPGVVHDVFAIVTFSDGSTATSNVVFFTVYSAPT